MKIDVCKYYKCNNEYEYDFMLKDIEYTYNTARKLFKERNEEPRFPIYLKFRYSQKTAKKILFHYFDFTYNGYKDDIIEVREILLKEKLSLL